MQLQSEFCPRCGSHNGLGARSAPRDTGLTRQELCPDTKDSPCLVSSARGMDPVLRRYPRSFMPAIETRLFTPRFFVMCGFSFTVFLSAFQLLPTAPFRVLALGGSRFAAGLFLGFLTYASALSAPFTGALADRFGKRRILIVASLVIAVFSTSYAVFCMITLLLGLA